MNSQDRARIGYDGVEGVSMDEDTRKRRSDERFTIVLPTELRRRIRDWAERTNRTESGMTRQLILEALETRDKDGGVD